MNLGDQRASRIQNRKLTALSEFGGVPDVAAARALGVSWVYFASWHQNLGPRKMEPAELRRLYNEPPVLNLGELPKDRWAPVAAPAGD